MSKRKPHNLQARIARSCRSLLASNHVAVVNIDPSGRQGMINYKSLKNIAPGKIGQAVCGIPHRWTISLDEAHAARIFEAVGAWRQVKVDSCAA